MPRPMSGPPAPKSPQKQAKKFASPHPKDLQFLCLLFRLSVVKFFDIMLFIGFFRPFAHFLRPRPPFNPHFSFFLITHNRETAVTAAMANPCSGRFNIGPVCGGTGVRGRGMPLPYKPWQTPNQTGWPRPSGQL